MLLGSKIAPSCVHDSWLVIFTSTFSWFSSETLRFARFVLWRPSDVKWLRVGFAIWQFTALKFSLAHCSITASDSSSPLLHLSLSSSSLSSPPPHHHPFPLPYPSAFPSSSSTYFLFLRSSLLCSSFPSSFLSSLRFIFSLSASSLFFSS